MKFNQVVTLDLKEFKKRSEEKYRYILYIIDMHTRLVAAAFIPNKRPEMVGKEILSKWIAVFGVMESLHAVRGGEITNKELTELAE